MKKLFLIAMIFSVISSVVFADEQKLYLYTWDTYAAPDLFKKFEKETGIQVITDIYSSNDTLAAKLKAGAAYDVVAPSGNYVPQLIAENLLQPLPSNLKLLATGMADIVKNPAYDPGNIYVLPLFYGTTALAVDAKLTQENIDSWQQFFVRPVQEAPSLGVLDDIGTVMDIASLALNKKFCDGSPDTLRSIQGLLLKQKPAVKVYGATGYFERLAANEVALQMAWSGDVYKVRRQNKDVRYVYPKEGVELWADNLAIPTTAKNVEAAEKFIRFVLKPENAAAYAAVSGNMPTISAAYPLLPDDLRNAPEFNIPPGTKTETSIACPPTVIRAYNSIWEKLTR
jgi:spermidine/putrescine transport system substrate-binding protein